MCVEVSPFWHAAHMIKSVIAVECETVTFSSRGHPLGDVGVKSAPRGPHS